jgi:hypothetical protein
MHTDPDDGGGDEKDEHQKQQQRQHQQAQEDQEEQQAQEQQEETDRGGKRESTNGAAPFGDNQLGGFLFGDDDNDVRAADLFAGFGAEEAEDCHCEIPATCTTFTPPAGSLDKPGTLQRRSSFRKIGESWIDEEMCVFCAWILTFDL